MPRTTPGTVTSADGTVISFETTGSGPALILVEAAGHYRKFSSFGGLVGLLAPVFRVFRYDRRGRGASSDTQPYDVAREVEDLAALITHAGGTASVYAFSSGGLLALHAAARGLPIRRLALLEPPIEATKNRRAQRRFSNKLGSLIDAGHSEAAVDFYLTGIGVPAEIVDGMRGTASWSAMTAVAATLVYDCLISEATSLDLLAEVNTPTLLLASAGSDDALRAMAVTVAQALPAAEHQTLPGEWHGISDEVLAAALIDFLVVKPAVESAAAQQG